VPHREDKHENDNIKEKSNGIVPGKHATPGRRESAAPRSAPD
jgi:hypothetical protein